MATSGYNICLHCPPLEWDTLHYFQQNKLPEWNTKLTATIQIIFTLFIYLLESALANNTLISNDLQWSLHIDKIIYIIEITMRIRQIGNVLNTIYKYKYTYIK